MGAFEAETLAKQLAQLGLDLSEEVEHLGDLEEGAADAEGHFRKLESVYDDCVDRAFLDAQGTEATRKAEAKLACRTERTAKQEANVEWNKAKGRVFTQNANLNAIRTRIDIGRSLLSREKSLLSLGGVGET